MTKITLTVVCAFLINFSYHLFERNSPANLNDAVLQLKDTVRNASAWPAELNVTNFAGPELTPEPCMPCSSSHR
jgi:hypothetical protein